MGWQNLGSEIREFIRGLFGSRLNSHLEEELMRVRQDHEARILEYVQQESGYRERIAQLEAKIEKYEMVLLPMVYGNLGGKKEPPTFLPMESNPDSWDAIQANYYRKQNEEESKRVE